MTITIETSDDMHALGHLIGRGAHRGDVIMLNGPLGAGKTTLTRGIGEALHVAGSVTSPTFVISRVHRGQAGGPDLVHVDAYRLNSAEELDALDLDSSLSDSVTVIEWGKDKAEVLAPERLIIDIERPEGGDDPLVSDAPRHVTLSGTGPVTAAWATELEALMAARKHSATSLKERVAGSE